MTEGHTPDLIERLRNSRITGNHYLRQDAADEIAALRDRVAALTKELDAAMIEIQVLRKAIAVTSISEADHALF